MKLHPNSNQPAKKLVKVKNEVQVRKNKRILRFLRNKKLVKLVHPTNIMNKKGLHHSRMCKTTDHHKIIVEDLKNRIMDHVMPVDIL